MRKNDVCSMGQTGPRLRLLKRKRPEFPSGTLTPVYPLQVNRSSKGTYANLPEFLYGSAVVLYSSARAFSPLYSPLLFPFPSTLRRDSQSSD